VTSGGNPTYLYGLRVLFGLSCGMVVLAAFPAGWDSFWAAIHAVGLTTMSLMSWLFRMIDVRNWTWRAFAVLSISAIVILVGVKTWLER